ncbi:MAG TPA: hypothetical protein VLA88_03835 [Candidatus Saccharimonadales bacterium]|nr:hypothetical protein [Candidatus Saccharimonadales bacterium]
MTRRLVIAVDVSNTRLGIPSPGGLAGDRTFPTNRDYWTWLENTARAAQAAWGSVPPEEAVLVLPAALTPMRRVLSMGVLYANWAGPTVEMNLKEALGDIPVSVCEAAEAVLAGELSGTSSPKALTCVSWDAGITAATTASDSLAATRVPIGHFPAPYAGNGLNCPCGVGCCVDLLVGAAGLRDFANGDFGNIRQEQWQHFHLRNFVQWALVPLILTHPEREVVLSGSIIDRLLNTREASIPVLKEVESLLDRFIGKRTLQLRPPVRFATAKPISGGNQWIRRRH